MHPARDETRKETQGLHDVDEYSLYVRQSHVDGMGLSVRETESPDHGGFGYGPLHILGRKESCARRLDDKRASPNCRHTLHIRNGWEGSEERFWRIYVGEPVVQK